jgi:hypothetical protein
MKAKIEELETNSKIKNMRHLYRGINYFEKGYHPIINIVKGEKGDFATYSHSIWPGGGTVFSATECTWG